MVFQDPLASLNPVLRIGFQIAERCGRTAPWPGRRRNGAVELLRHVGVPDAEAGAMDYPHHFSGGMRQRVLIASAISCGPEVIIAGAPPDPRRRPSGCPFHPRCPDAVPDCRRVDPALQSVSARQSVACIMAQRAMADA